MLAISPSSMVNESEHWWHLLLWWMRMLILSISPSSTFSQYFVWASAPPVAAPSKPPSSSSASSPPPRCNHSHGSSHSHIHCLSSSPTSHNSSHFPFHDSSHFFSCAFSPLAPSTPPPSSKISKTKRKTQKRKVFNNIAEPKRNLNSWKTRQEAWKKEWGKTIHIFHLFLNLGQPSDQAKQQLSHLQLVLGGGGGSDLIQIMMMMMMNGWELWWWCWWWLVWQWWQLKTVPHRIALAHMQTEPLNFSLWCAPWQLAEYDDEQIILTLSVMMRMVITDDTEEKDRDTCLYFMKNHKQDYIHLYPGWP